MKKPYEHPVSYLCNTSGNKPLLVGSSHLMSPNNSQKDYYCPYVPSLYCRRYSEYMNAWKRSVEYAANNNLDQNIYETSGCTYERLCEVYRLYMYRKQHENNGK